MPILRAPTLTLLLMLAPQTASASEVASEKLHIDPALIALSAELWQVLASDDNPVWPGWNTSETPLLFYIPNVQELLVNHPNPPEGFVPFEGPPYFDRWDLDWWELSIHTGPTLIQADAQNTARTIAGVRTLVVADPTSNRRSTLDLLLRGAAETGELPESLDQVLRSDPYEQLAFVTHEAFHVHQMRLAGNKAADEQLLRQYPVLSVLNNVGFAQEGAYLERALRAETQAAAREAALLWLAIRADRRASLPPAAVTYEDGTEFNEGLAKYTEYRLWQVLEGRESAELLTFFQGFHGLADLAEQREEMLRRLVRHLRGEVDVNRDPYGTAPLRMRLYFSGLGIGALLDRISDDWKIAILEPGTTLTSLAREALRPSSAELAGALQAALADPARAQLLESKAQLLERGLAHTEKLLEQIQHGENTTLVFDFSEMGASALQMAYTPFGLRVIDDDRTIYTAMPYTVRLGSGNELQQTAPSPMLQTNSERSLTFQLGDKVGLEQLLKAARLTKLDDQPVENLAFELPGVRITAERAQLHWNADRITVTLRRRPG